MLGEYNATEREQFVSDVRLRLSAVYGLSMPIDINYVRDMQLRGFTAGFVADELAAQYAKLTRPARD